MNINKSPVDEGASCAPEGRPLGAGVGAALGGAAAGALTGSVAGPVGTVIGIAVGAIAGGFAGKEFADLVDPEADEKQWHENYATRANVPDGSTFSDFAPAFSFGIAARTHHPGRTFDVIEAELRAGWPMARGDSRLDWTEARPAVYDAWSREDSAPATA